MCQAEQLSIFASGGEIKMKMPVIFFFVGRRILSDLDFYRKNVTKKARHLLIYHPDKNNKQCMNEPNPRHCASAFWFMTHSYVRLRGGIRENGLCG